MPEVALVFIAIAITALGISSCVVWLFTPCEADEMAIVADLTPFC